MKILKLTLIVALATLALGHAPAGAERGKQQQIARKNARGAGASVTGVYSGVLRGTIAVGTEMVVIPRTVPIVDLEGNSLAPGVSLSKRAILVSGQMREGKLVAAFVVVGAVESRKDFSQETLPNMEADPDRAR